jgi:hypothetical protein
MWGGSGRGWVGQEDGVDNLVIEAYYLARRLASRDGVVDDVLVGMYRE